MKEFDIPAPQWPDGTSEIEAVVRQLKEALGSKDALGPPEVRAEEVRYAIPPDVVKAMVDIATNAWKAKDKMVDRNTGEIREEMKRVYRPIEAVLETLRGIGLELKDHTGDAFDYGLPLKVVTSQPTRGLTRESVLETLKPTIYWRDQLIQMGEVVIAIPA